jgi:hypothetical protein
VVAEVSLLKSLRSRFNGQSTELFGQGQRYPLTDKMVKSIKKHEVSLRSADLGAFKFERRRSTYHDAKSDLVIYNAEGTPVLNGREFDGPLSFWTYQAT